MAVGKTNASGGGGAVKYSEAQSLTSAQKVQAINNIGTMRVYHTVTELGLTSGSATLAAAWAAMTSYSMLICGATDFASTEWPNTSNQYGSFEIIRLAETRGRISFIYKDKADPDYVMHLQTDSNTNITGPSGVWKCTRNLKITFSSVSSLPQTADTNTALFITDTMTVLNCTLSNPAAQTGDWTITTAKGSVSVSGTISGTTNIELILGEV